MASEAGSAVVVVDDVTLLSMATKAEFTVYDVAVPAVVLV